MKKKAVELFCGVGGVTESLKRHYNIRCSIEMDPIIARSYAANHGDDHLTITDINKLDSGWWEDFKSKEKSIDLLVSTPPCQGFSAYNRNRNKEFDSRNNLVFHTNTVANILQPKFIFFENVVGFTKHPYFKIFLNKLQNLDSEGNKINKNLPSYQIRFSVVNAADYGVPQNRKRIILIAKKIESFPSSESVLSLNSSNIQVSGAHEIWPDSNEKVTLGEYLSKFKISKLSAGERDSVDHLHTTMNLSLKNLKRIEMTPHNGGTKSSWEEDLLLPSQLKNNNNFKDVYGRMDYSKQSPTITTGCITLSKGRFGHPIENRAISLREAALIQTFPLNYCFYGDLKSGPNMGSKVNIAMQIGNAVPVKLAAAFIEKISKY
ncbi:DNA cytosine methyltransferase [Exiguobacterium sp. s154]|uniref:DNA cytosine methyltransferase n=1 Tax=Exiguobacterium sp. s154 TaxID=2751277 RepID=UPI001BEB2147|nr:DNA cytosine methyltransferase [Exiguobacterium sp. s154]